MPLLTSIPEQVALGPMLRLFGIADNALLDYRSALMFSGEPLGGAECELIATYVSSLNRCGYCVGSHRVVAEAQGIDAGLLDAIAAEPAGAAFDARLAPLLSLMARLTTAPSDVAAGEVSAALAAGWREDQLAHAVAVCAFFNCANRIADGTGIEHAPPGLAAVRDRLAARPSGPFDATNALLRHHAGLMRGPSPLSVGERAMLACLVSALNGSPGGVAGHRAAAEANGIAPPIMAAILDDPRTSPDERIGPLADYVRILTLRPGAIGAAEVRAVFEAGWSEEALFHAISVCALANLLDRLTGCPGIAPDPAISALRKLPEEEAGRTGQAAPSR